MSLESEKQRLRRRTPIEDIQRIIDQELVSIVPVQTRDPTLATNLQIRCDPDSGDIFVDAFYHEFQDTNKENVVQGMREASDRFMRRVETMVLQLKEQEGRREKELRGSSYSLR